jgi:hypothetical protein
MPVLVATCRYGPLSNPAVTVGLRSAGRGLIFFGTGESCALVSCKIQRRTNIGARKRILFMIVKDDVINNNIILKLLPGIHLSGN